MPALTVVKPKLTSLTESVSPSSSVSVPAKFWITPLSTLFTVSVASSVVVLVSGKATGASLMPPTLTVTVAVSLPPWPSLTT